MENPNENSHTEFKLFDKMWATANLITGFAVAQGLLFAQKFTQADTPFVAAVNTTNGRTLVSVGTIIAIFGYAGALYWCYHTASVTGLHGSRMKKAFRQSTVLRIIIAVLFSLMPLWALVGLHFSPPGKKTPGFHVSLTLTIDGAHEANSKHPQH